ncbi:alpha/beta hydrolase domain-containing protein 17C [Oryx dammah]|uniref:alpha/beta hydrolase domain-containing protein 17C n=1 Tax=Oryx dammah TaxID=59534 RepID=UPI001A9AE467|nr:alpha/beta hydrolase domain-containing protein 17C [Oryx dammah]
MQPTSLTAALEYLDIELEFCAGVTQTKGATKKRGVCLHHHVPASSCDVPEYGVSPENIILYGQSIGTVPTVDLASRYECAAVILHSPLMSGLRVAFPDTRKTYCFDAFPSIDKISKVTSPVLVIHGTEDEVIDFSHGLAMYERCPRAVEPLWVEGAGHNDIELYAQYLERLKQFISHELPNS